MLSEEIYNETYFKERTFTDKHYKEAMNWILKFKLNENSAVLDYGCGLGFYGHALRYLGIDDVWGYDISEYARKNGYELMKGRILEKSELNRFNGKVDLVVCYDVLEHIPETDGLDVLKELLVFVKSGGYVLFSICMEGDPNLEMDKTHITKKTRIWWEYWIKNAGFDIVDSDGLWFRHQLIVATKK